MIEPLIKLATKPITIDSAATGREARRLRA